MLDIITALPQALASLLGEINLLRDAIHALAAALDVPARLAAFIAANADALKPLLTSFIQSTAAMPDGGDFTTDATIARFVPITTGVADAALVLVVGFAFFRVMWAHGTYSQFTARTMLPRLLMAGFLINFSTKLVQASVDGSNVLSQTALKPLDGLPWIHLVDTGGSPLLDTGPGLSLAVSVALFTGFLLLGLAYFVRYALLVILTILAPLAALLMVLPETQAHARAWASLFVSTLLMQPLQLLILVIGSSLEVVQKFPPRHLFALAALWICFKVPGALHAATSVGSHAGSAARSHAHKLVAQTAKAAARVAI